MLLLNGYVFWARAAASRSLAAGRRAARPAALDLDALPSCAARVESGSFEDDSTPEENFAFGLDRMLDGIAALIARRA